MAREQRKPSGALGRFLRRMSLTLVTVLIMAAAGSWGVLNLRFTGPSPAARDALTLSLSQSKTTDWIPGLFLDEALVEQICESTVYSETEE